jgi:hypothetical protein
VRRSSIPIDAYNINVQKQRKIADGIQPSIDADATSQVEIYFPLILLNNFQKNAKISLITRPASTTFVREPIWLADGMTKQRIAHAHLHQVRKLLGI